MKAVIPAAGEGKRFNKDSTYMHKCLVPINGKALLLYTLENLTNIKEITECIVIIGENHEKIIDTIGTKVNDTPILFCKQKQSVKGVVGAIESAVEEIGNDDFILVLADEFVYENNYAEAIEKFKTSTNECMVGLYYEKHLEYVKKNYTFIKSPDGFLYNFIEKPQIVYNNCSGTGNIIFKNTVLGAIKKVKENKERHEKELVDLLNLICATGKIQSFVVGNYYCSLKDSLVIAEEGLGLLNNENILKLVWSSGIISGFSMEDNNGNVAKIIIQPNIKYKIFEIIYIEDEDKLPERWTNILISFMKKLYRETLEAKTLVEDGEKVVLIYKAFNKVVLDSSFKAIGILKKEYQQKDVYVYSSEQ